MQINKSGEACSKLRICLKLYTSSGVIVMCKLRVSPEKLASWCFRQLFSSQPSIGEMFNRNFYLIASFSKRRFVSVFFLRN